MIKRIFCFLSFLLMIPFLPTTLKASSINSVITNEITPLLNEDFEKANLSTSAFKAPITSSWKDGFAYNDDTINGKFSFYSPSNMGWDTFLQTDSSLFYIGGQQKITITLKVKILEALPNDGFFYIEGYADDVNFRYLRVDTNGNLLQSGAKGADDGSFKDWYIYQTGSALTKKYADNSIFVKFTFTTSCEGYAIKLCLNTGTERRGRVVVDDINIYSGDKFNIPSENVKESYVPSGNEKLYGFDTDSANITNYNLRGNYHYTPSKNFLNDINGPIYYNGFYHVFYQYSADTQGAATKEWFHIVSKDLINWEEVGVALTYDKPYDATGPWSGNAFFDKNGLPVLIYYANGTGLCLARPKDYTDPYLREWVKDEHNPVIKKNDFKEESPYGVYDVSNVWIMNDRYYVLTGNKDANHLPMSYLFSSSNLIDWTFEGEFLKPDSNMNAFDDFACPNIMLINEKEGIYLFTFSSHYLGVRYYTGKIVNNKLQILDFGAFTYAGGVEMANACCYDEFGRVLYFCWMREQRTSKEHAESGWNGGMTMGRIITCDDNGKITIKPFETYDSLKQDTISFENIQVNNAEKLIEGFTGDSYVIEAEIDVHTAKQVGFNVLMSPGKKEYTSLYYDSTSKTMKIDYANSSINKYNYSYYMNGFCGYIYRGYQESSVRNYKTINIKVYVDGSFLEIYINDEFTMSQRIYPALESSKQVSIFANEGRALFKKLSISKMSKEG